MPREPRLRNVEKYKAPYALNTFPADFALTLGREIVYLLATRNTPQLEGGDWEQIFARLIGARWKPSNVGLDDVVLEQTAWGAKTVKASNPSKTKRVRLISGRNSPVYSYGDKQITHCDPSELADKVIEIWNERVAAIKKNYKHLRTIVLIKSDDLLECAAFEYDTMQFDSRKYVWSWNRNNNLVGFCQKNADHKFTWQPHGSQFTIVENVPQKRLAIRIKQPPSLDRDQFLSAISFEPSWIEIL
jgi:hypothetical protein